jgi:hypothetical protein
VFLTKVICPFLGVSLRGVKTQNIRALEWKWKKDGTLVPSEMTRSLAQDNGVDPYPGSYPTCIE